MAEAEGDSEAELIHWREEKVSPEVIGGTEKSGGEGFAAVKVVLWRRRWGIVVGWVCRRL